MSAEFLAAVQKIMETLCQYERKGTVMADRRQLYGYKGDKCANCQLSVQESVNRYGTIERLFELNHVDPTLKHPQYSNLIRRVLSTEQLDEVDKCVLLCRNCHGILHAQGKAGHVEFNVTVAGHTASQLVNGQLIIDSVERQAKFLTNERVLVIPYRVRLGDSDPQLHFGTALEKEGVLISLIRALPKIKRLSVSSYRDGKPLLDIAYIGDGEMKMKMDIRFPVLSSELCRDESDKPFVWIRNGVALTKDGKVIQDGTIECKGVIVGV